MYSSTRSPGYGPGLTAEIRTPAYPGKVWEGKVEFVYPEVHPKARTLRARLEFKNPDELLMPNMFVEATIYGGPKRDVLILPREALILSGEREWWSRPSVGGASSRWS